MIEYTFAMIKPDAVLARNSGAIIKIIEENGFEILRMHKIQLIKEAAEEFYEEHKEKPFFKEMVDFICSGPVIILALAKENAVKEWRNLIGATDSRKAAAGTIRATFGTDIGNNAVHGSDSQESAERELSMFFVDEDDFNEEDEDKNDEFEFCDEEDCEEDEDCCRH
ncbi:MAG TPA: nucleoside-diphosphate kinase [Patescibacteria group bacterium]|jgi:nucleoside-diphosphate kinase|nr:nucleoside-diphosphate kinase [Patescibacteria group bacterium]